MKKRTFTFQAVVEWHEEDEVDLNALSGEIALDALDTYDKKDIVEMLRLVDDSGVKEEDV